MAADKDIEKQVEELLAKMMLSEKIGQMVQINGFKGKIPDELRQKLREGKIGSMLNEIVPETSLELQRITREESRLGIPLIMGRDVIHGYRTIFPIPLAQAATWEPSLAQAAARVAAKEAAHAGFHWTFAPMMDITHDPRWGRIAEGFGEDSYLGSLFAAAMVRGFQGDNLSSPDTIAACAKHYVGYGAAEGGRDYNTAYIPENLLHDVYLPPFKAALEAGVASVMSAFNEINGVPATGNVHTIREILKERWKFDGFVVSDWNSTAEMISHGYCEDMKDVAKKSITAGIDMEMQSTAYSDYLEELVTQKVVPEELIDDAVKRILRIKFKLGLFEKPSVYSAKLPEKPDEESLALAKEIATKSIVLLKNENKLLPLLKELKSIAVIGPMADDPYEVLGTWNRDGKIEDTVTPLAAVRDMVGDNTEINYIAGLPYSRSKDTSEFAKAIKLAKKSEVVLFFAGEESILSGEAHSRAFLNLPGAQDVLITEIAKTGTPIVLIVLAGRPLCIGDIIEKVDAILYAWHPGTMCGPAIADLIFGIESPSGKLPVTFPKTEGQIPIYYNHKNSGRPPEGKSLTMIDDIPLRAYQSSLGDTSRYLDIGFEPLYPFGYGLSYTQFEYSNLRLAEDKIKVSDAIKVFVDVTNTGDMEADEVVQLYIRDLVASLTRPVKELKGFKRIRLKPNETRKINFELSASNLGFHTNEGNYIVEAGKFNLWVGGDSNAGLMTQFEIVE
ncbi:MAG: beta-glucosidase BglX [Sedimentisphaerales bacterium]|nr:beta-glucosidase BglX [Sedimentisphaerales bacterium]